MNSQADEFHTILSKYEKEMNVKVQRMDIVRDRYAKHLYDLLQETLVEPYTSSSSIHPMSFLSRVSSSSENDTEMEGEEISSSSSSSDGHPYSTVYKNKQRNKTPGPLLYHRHSRQFIHDVSTVRNALKMRSWIKGRLLFLLDDVVVSDKDDDDGDHDHPKSKQQKSHSFSHEDSEDGPFS